MPFRIFRTQLLDKQLRKSTPDIQQWCDRVEDQLRLNPYVGDPLRVPWFREKKLHKHRVYYLIYDDLQAVYLVTLSEKKDQQATINTIWLFLDTYKEEIQKLLRK